MAGKKNKKKGQSKYPTPPPIADDDNDDLVNELLEQLGSSDVTAQAESAALLNEMDLNTQADNLEAQPKQTAKDRYKARQARKAAALAQSFSPDDPANEARLKKEADDERRAIWETCKQLDLTMHEINPDGHCLFSAIADQFALLGVIPPEQARYDLLRAAAANYIYTHPDDFLPFLPSSEGEDGYGADAPGLMSPEQFRNYCESIKDTAIWGGEPEILALSRAFKTPIHVVQAGQPRIVVHSPTTDGTSQTTPPARISYHRRMYGLGEHYNSLRPVPPVS
ncbi:hypothetical protein NMY22_g2474 [Coprinellus aureogranulatus]|nr:hypothetical protein NMY22_g2474 [Coprinellus aureogranulatus]